MSHFSTLTLTNPPHRSISVAIPQVLDGDYGLYTWPAASALAAHVYARQDAFIGIDGFSLLRVCSSQGKNVLELGAGNGLPGIVASLCGAHVWLSDRTDAPSVLENCRSSCVLNHTNAQGSLRCFEK
jgi:predicted nicotinamide N-methyase